MTRAPGSNIASWIESTSEKVVSFIGQLDERLGESTVIEGQVVQVDDAAGTDAHTEHSPLLPRVLSLSAVAVVAGWFVRRSLRR